MLVQGEKKLVLALSKYGIRSLTAKFLEEALEPQFLVTQLGKPSAQLVEVLSTQNSHKGKKEHHSEHMECRKMLSNPKNQVLGTSYWHLQLV